MEILGESETGRSWVPFFARWYPCGTQKRAFCDAETD